MEGGGRLRKKRIERNNIYVCYIYYIRKIVEKKSSENNKMKGARGR